MSFNGNLYATDSGEDLTTKGDLHSYSTSNDRLPVGVNTQVLTADSTQTFGMKWAAASAGGLTVNKIQGTNTALFETTSASFVDTGLDLTLSNETDGNALVIATFNAGNTTDGSGARCNLSNDGTEITSTNVSAEAIGSNSTNYMSMALTTIADTDGSVINIEMKAGGGTARMIYSANNYTPQINAMEFY